MSEAIRVNVDYEAELFHGRGAPPVINKAMEFLGFFLDERPLLTSKMYSEEYLRYLEKLLGRKPQTVSKGRFVNWWGELKDIPREKWLNSKMTSARLVQEKKWCDRTFIIETIQDIHHIPFDRKYVAKSPFGMSGQSFQILDSESTLEERKTWFERALDKGPLVVEPLLNRKEDFSHYVFPDGKVICYENVVDQKFQYKGTMFNDYRHPVVNNLSLYPRVKEEEWEKFFEAFKDIQRHYQQVPNFGYSVDSFLYEEEGELKIRFLSEVNYRRTMGRCAYELALKFAGAYPWCMLTLTKSFHQHGGFSFLRDRLKEMDDVVILSPGDTRFDLFFLRAKNREEGQKLLKKLGSLLPDGQFAVKL